MPRDAFTLVDVREPTIEMACEPCGRRGRYNVERLIAKHGPDMKLLYCWRTSPTARRRARSTSATDARRATSAATRSDAPRNHSEGTKRTKCA
jgi:hypothetical protein